MIGGATMVDNSVLLGYVKDITVAKLTSDTHYACDKSGEDTADFMQQVYDKLSELNQKETK